MASGQSGWAAAGRVALLGLVVGMGVLAWYALLGGPVPALADAEDLLLGLAPIPLLPGFYLAAWQVMTFGSLRRALTGAAVSLALCTATFFVALGLGLVSAGLLTLPAGLVGVVVIARDLARRDADDAAPGPGAGRRAHMIGLLLGYVGLLPALLQAPEAYGGPVAPCGVTALGLLGLLAPMVLICLPHVLLTAPWGARAPRGRPGRAGAVLLLLAWMPGAFTLGPLWPLRIAPRQAAFHVELLLFQEAGGYGPGRYAGEVIEAIPGPHAVTFVVPEGWLGLVDRRHRPRGAARSIEIAPDPRATTPEALLRRLRLQAPFGSPALSAAPDRHELGCTAPDPALGGAFLCRQSQFAEADAANPALLARLPDASIAGRLYARWHAGSAGYLAAGPGLAAWCNLGAACTLRFMTREGAEVAVEIPEPAFPRWREARAEAARLLQAAAGLTLDEASPAPPVPLR